MHLKDPLGSFVRVGYRIPFPDFYLVLHGLRCRKSTIMDYTKPNHENQQIQFYKNIQKFINRKNNENEENIWILGGDFNIAQEIIDRKGGLDCIKKNVLKEIDGLKDFLNLHNACMQK